MGTFELLQALIYHGTIWSEKLLRSYSKIDFLLCSEFTFMATFKEEEKMELMSLMKEIETQIILQNIEKVQELTQILCKVATFGMTQTPQTVKHTIAIFVQVIVAYTRSKNQLLKNSCIITQKDRKCDWCGKSKTLQWRSGPSNGKLCNACGLQYRIQRKQFTEYEKAQRKKFSVQSLLN